MSVHRIRLKGPWQFEWIGDAPAASGSDWQHSGRVKMPAEWSAIFGPAAGTVRFRRRFHRPTNLDDDERVWIVFDALGGTGTVLVNGAKLGELVTSATPQRFDMTAELQPSSELIVELTYSPAEPQSNAGGLFAPVAIEIEQAAREAES